ncbi:efflux RND transporter periplasmic adaptor subunit [Psychromonas sp. B3M02]|uniref:efflux RND transporter periplasmic adaptor subunit n=1 Tax=Psychromonas sp. B3M02 TaxID=2267226 RepID=UPI000DE9E4DF|nr:efflux RND transporter periplasmic adaptor subunit [Psychromonas sp. B3M02]RBW46543.1 efflux RND transporter periplasmic adaptor subunit [Psychromonas sp. B3M02]
MRYLLTLLVGLLTGFLLNQSGIFQLSTTHQTTMAGTEMSTLKVKYWVAPMDANYRRDKPGKSPMGMDLIPVYEEDKADTEKGTVKISPAVENNLGLRTAAVDESEFKVKIDSFGQIQENEDAVWQINSRVSGWVEKLYVKSVGGEVKAGEKLYELYSPELVKAQTSLFNAIKLNRSALVESSKARLNALGVSQHQIRQIIKSKKVSQSVTVYAPEDGTISELNVNEGAYISPSVLVVKAVNLDSVWVEIEVFSEQASLVKLGDLAAMTLDYFPGQEWVGKVDFIYPEMSEQNRALRVRLQFENPTNQLKPNMFSSVVLTPTISGKRLQVPREAVIYGGNMNRVVLAMGEGKFRSVLVKTGLENKDLVEVLSGLEIGQKVVTSAQFLLDSESSISADFERMLEEQNKKEEQEYDPNKEDEDLDWLDFSALGIHNVKPFMINIQGEVL